MGQHKIISLRWEPLERLINDPEYGKQEMILEGFPDMAPDDFVAMYCKMNKCEPSTLVHRMEFVYVDGTEG